MEEPHNNNNSHDGIFCHDDSVKKAHQQQQQPQHYDESSASDQTAKKILDNIIVGYAFGPKKMETMGLIMAEASTALSTFECAGVLPSQFMNKKIKKSSTTSEQQQQQQQQQQRCNADFLELMEDSSM